MTCRVLYLGSDPGPVAQLSTRTGDPMVVSSVSDPDVAIEQLTGWPYDCVLCDLSVASDDRGFLRRLRETAPELPIVARPPDQNGGGLVDEFGDRVDRVHDDDTTLGETIDRVVREEGTVSSTTALAGTVTSLLERSPDRTAPNEGDRRLDPPRAVMNAVLDRLTDVFFLFDLQGTFLYWNDRLTEVTGYTDEEIASMTPMDFFVEDDRASVEAALSRIVDDGDAVEVVRIRTSDGTAIPYEFTGSLVTDDGTPTYICGIGRDVSRHHRSERALREREQALTNLIRNVPGVVYRYRNEPDLPVEFMSDGCLDLTGYTHAQLETGEISWGRDVIHPEDRDDVRRDVRRAVETGEQYQLTYRILTADGEQRWVMERGHGVTSSDDVDHLDGYITEITDLVEAERELRREREKFRSLVQGVEEYAIYTLDPDGTVVSWNQGAEESLGYAAEEIVGEHLSCVYTAEARDRRRPERNLAEAVENGWAEDHGWRVRKDGSRFWADVVITAVYDDELSGFTIVTRDLTEKREIREALRREKAFTESALDAQQDLFYVFDTNGTFLYWNDRLNEVTGYTDEEIASMRPTDFVASEEVEDVTEAIAAVASDGSTLSIEATLVTGEGTRIPYEFTGSVVDDVGDVFSDEDSAEGTYICGTGRDISQRIQAERELEAAIDELERSNAELERFAYVASHDLKEPLRMISSYLELIERRYGDELDDDADEFIGYAVDGADRMRRMIDDLLAYSRIGTEETTFGPVDCDTVLGRVRDNLQVAISETDAEITVDDLPTVRGNVRQLVQLFQNLLNNAITYAGDDPPRIHVSAHRDDGWVFSVADEGIGLDDDQIDEVFEIFYSGDHDASTGIGLAICKKIATNHGGDIWVESEPGEGSTFFVRIPAVETDDLPPPDRTPEA